MQTRAIKSKIKSTQSIRKITRTMEMVSVAKMKKSLLTAEGYKAFTLEAKRILAILGEQREKHPLQVPNDSHKKLLIVIGGQKGLCGGFNTNVYRKVYKYVKDNAGHVDFICIGKYGEKIAKKFDADTSSVIASFNEKVFSMSSARVLTKTIVSAFLEGAYSGVDVIYTDFENINSQRVDIVQLLPFSNKNFDNKDSIDGLEYTFEPNVTVVYDRAIKIILQNILSAFVARSSAAEHAARMMAMKTATDNAGEMLGELKLWYNKVRQAGITQEIAEISSGALAIAK